MKVRLYIADTLVDLKDNSLILMNYTMGDLTNPSIVKNSYSQQVTLPGTPVNNDLFGGIYRLDRTQEYNGLEAGVAFNPSVKTPFVIRNDKDEVLESGYMKLDKVNRTGRDVEYVVSLYGDLGAFFYALAYNTSGNKRTLADIDFLGQGNKEHELDFTINAAFVTACWSYLDGDIPYPATDKMGVINFAPCYNGIPDNFDANKGLISPASCGLKASVEVDGTTYSTKSGYTLVEMPEEVTEWAAKDLRSYLQRPVLSVAAFLNALQNPDNCGGYSFDCSEILDRAWEYGNLWLTLPLLPSLPTYRQESHTLTLTPSTSLVSGSTYIPITIGATIPANTKVSVNLNMSLALYCEAAATAGLETLDYFRYTYSQDGFYTNYDSEISGLFLQLVAYDASGNAIGASKVVCVGDTKGSYTAGGYTAGMPKDTATRAKASGYTPVYSSIDDLWGDYYGVTPARRDSSSSYYDFDKEMSFDLEAYDIASLRLYVTPYLRYYSFRRHVIFGETYKSQGWRFAENAQRISNLHYASYAGVAGTRSNTATYQTTDTLRSGARVTKAMLLSTDYTPADLLLSFTKTFGLYYTTDKAAKTISVHFRNTFYEDETIDLDDKIDRSQKMTIEPFVFDTKWLVMEQEVEGAFADTYKDLYGVTYGMQRIDTGYDFNAEAKALMDSCIFKGGVTSLEYGRYYNYVTQDGQFRPSPFLTAGCKQVLWDSSGSTTEVDISVPASPVISNYGEEDANLPGYDYPLERKLQFHDSEGKPTDGDGVLVVLNSTANYYHFKVTDDNATMNNLNNGVPCWWLYSSNATLRIPIFSRYRDGDGWEIQDSLDFGRPRELNAPGLVYYPSEHITIYERAWRNYLHDRYDVNTRVVSCYVDLSGLQVSEELLRKFYRFDNSLWVLNKITNYSLTSVAPTLCEFVRVQDKANYLTGQVYSRTSSSSE